MRKSFLLLLALLLPLTARADTAANYAWAFPLDTSKPAENYRVTLTTEILASLNPAAQQADMVVVNTLGRPVPFGLLQAREPQLRDYTQKARLLPVPPAADGQDGDIKRNADGSIVISPAGSDKTAHSKQWLLDAGRAVSLHSIALDPDSVQKDFQATFSIEVSDDLQQWREAGYSNYATLTRMGEADDRIEQLTINLSNAGFARYYRFTLEDGAVEWNAGQAPSVTLVGGYKDEAADRAAQWQWLEVQAKPGSANGDYDYELPAGLSLDAIKAQLPPGNGAARVHVLVSGGTQLNQIATLDLVRSENQGEATSIFTSRVAAKMVRLHTDTPLTQAPVVRVAWVPPQYIFMADGNAPYRLLVGSHAARRGDYPPFFDTGDYADAVPGARVAAAGETALQAPRDPNSWTRPVLWAVLAGGALLVIGMAWSLLRQSRREDEKERIE